MPEMDATTNLYQHAPLTKPSNGHMMVPSITPLTGRCGAYIVHVLVGLGAYVGVSSMEWNISVQPRNMEVFATKSVLLMGEGKMGASLMLACTG